MYNNYLSKYFKKYNELKKEYLLMKSNNHYLKLRLNIINGYIIKNEDFSKKIVLDDELKIKINKYFETKFIKDFDKFLEKNKVDDKTVAKIKPGFKFKIVNNKYIFISGYVQLFNNNGKKREEIINWYSKLGFNKIDNEYTFVFPIVEFK